MVEYARTVVVSHPDELSEWGRQRLYADRYVKYLRRAVEDVEAGDVWEEFVDVGCCGDTLDVRLRVESVEGPSRMGPETEIEFVEREETIRGGWAVQGEEEPEVAQGR